MSSAPVALIIFRRPDLTAKVLDAVRAVKPPALYVIADGPRADKPDEAQACEAARAVIDTVDWDCQIHRHYSDTNLGCGHRPASGIDWLFQQVESAIILEDDCIPHPSFFGYCDEVLERYREDERVMHVSGCTYRAQPWDTDKSFFFTRFPACWGWATWRRAWQHYDIHCGDWPRLRDSRFMDDVTGEPAVSAYWANRFDEAWQSEDMIHHTWDYQWAFACWANSGLAICPRHNLISNIGWGDDATHTFGLDGDTMALPTFEMGLPLKHPENVLPDPVLNRQYVEELLLPSALKWQNRNKKSSPLNRMIKGALPGPVKRMIRRVIK